MEKKLNVVKKPPFKHIDNCLNFRLDNRPIHSIIFEVQIQGWFCNLAKQYCVGGLEK